MVRELVIPPETEGDDRATEMIRVWLAHDDMHVSLMLGMWADADDTDVPEEEVWGNLLADVARHVANGLQQSHGFEALNTLKKIKQAFLENLERQERQMQGRYFEN